MDQIKVVVSTSQLRTMLEADPKVYAQLEAMACEKIAEEITRKLIATSGAVHKQIEAQLKTEMSRYSYASSLPAAAKDAIQTAVNKVVRDQLTELTNTFKTDLGRIVAAENDRLKKIVDQRIEAASEKLDGMVKQASENFNRLSADRIEKQARATFIEVIREAKSVI